MAELESVIEKRLIEQLVMGESQWTYRPDLNNEEKLWANFRYILEQNNKDKLDDKGLSDAEFAQVKNQVSHASFYDAGKWLSGENGRVYVHVQRGNEQLHLLVVNHEQVAGGKSVYEVINQYQAFKNPDEDMSRDRRFDVSLLINGLPLIHVELKNKAHSYMDGFRQIKKYIGEGKFQGIFSNVQMFVVSNSVDTRYFAAARDTELNSKFLTGWLDKENNPVGDYLEFAKSVLKIPEAHEMVSKYTVLDNDKQRLLLLRPYQVHAIEEMRKASKKGVSGFIWHTTGSGKTMTSFKSAQLIASSGHADKVVFLMDRIELGTQSLQEYRGFAGDAESVQATENTGVLVTKLKSDDPADTLIVTSIQKMSRITEEDGYKGKDIESINRKRLVFIVDECHRDTFGDMMSTIKSTFPNAMFFGFTGTPIHDENKKKMNTTTDVFGDELHRYSIADGIRDKNVLGFHPTMVATYDENDLREAVALERAKADSLAEVFSDPKKEAVYYRYRNDVPMAGYEDDSGAYVRGIEDDLPTAQYDRDVHRMAVVEDIQKNWIRLSRNGKFHAILATSSIPEAIEYYRLFKSKAPELKVTPRPKVMPLGGQPFPPPPSSRKPPAFMPAMAPYCSAMASRVRP
jgi:type I restriction enzyme R subunit